MIGDGDRVGIAFIGRWPTSSIWFTSGDRSSIPLPPDYFSNSFRFNKSGPSNL